MTEDKSKERNGQRKELMQELLNEDDFIVGGKHLTQICRTPGTIWSKREHLRVHSVIDCLDMLRLSLIEKIFVGLGCEALQASIV